MTSARAIARAAGRSPGATIGLAIVGLLALAALLAPILAPFPQDAGTATNLLATLQPPGPEHPLGTDMAGRDVWSRILFGVRVSVGAAVDPGHADKSRLYRFVAGLDQPSMPPGKRLPESDVDLLKRWIDAGAPKPAAIVAFPVGFVGAAESKEALHANPRGIPYATLLGRRGGSAMAAAVINALTRGTQ